MLLFQSFRDDLIDHIKNTPDDIFFFLKTSRAAILGDSGVLDYMWGLYQKNIEDYGLSAEDSYRDVLANVFGISF